MPLDVQGTKKINYAQFMTALSLIAALKKVPPQELVQAVLACGGPVINSSLVPDPAPCTPDGR